VSAASQLKYISSRDFPPVKAAALKALEELGMGDIDGLHGRNAVASVLAVDRCADGVE